MQLHIEFDEFKNSAHINSSLITVLDLAEELGCACYTDLESGWSRNNNKVYKRTRVVDIEASDVIINYMKLRLMRYQYHKEHLDYCLYGEEEILEELEANGVKHLY